MLNGGGGNEGRDENFSILFWHIKDSMVHARAAGKGGGEKDWKKRQKSRKIVFHC